MVAAPKYLQVCTGSVARRRRRSVAFVPARKLYKYSFRRRMNGVPTNKVPLYQTSCVRERNFRNTKFLFNSRESKYRRKRQPLYIYSRKIALAFLMDWAHDVISTFPLNHRTGEGDE